MIPMIRQTKHMIPVRENSEVILIDPKGLFFNPKHSGMFTTVFNWCKISPPCTIEKQGWDPIPSWIVTIHFSHEDDCVG